MMHLKHPMKVHVSKEVHMIGGSRMIVMFFLSILVSAPLEAQSAQVADYRIGPGDVLSIMVWDNKDLDQKVFVRPDGKISLALLGQIDAGGLTVAELATALTDMYSKTVKGAQVVVDVLDIRSRAVYFVGGVTKAGQLPLMQDLTLLQAIALVGGLDPGADLAGATVLRENRIVPVDFVKLFRNGDLNENIRLQPGDTIFVPLTGFVYMQGEVKAPQPIRFTKDLTIVKAVVQAGGFTPMAAPKRVTVLRGVGDKKEFFEINVSRIMENGRDVRDVPLEPNDIVTVPQRLF